MTDDYFVLSQCMRLVEGQTDGRTKEQNCHRNTARCIAYSRTVKWLLLVICLEDIVAVMCQILSWG